MGIIPAAALFDVAASYAADALTEPLPVAIATVLAVLTVIGLRILGDGRGRRPKTNGPAWLRARLLERSPRAAVAVALVPCLPRRVPQTRMPRPALPDVAASRLLRGPPGPDSPSRQPDTGGGNSPR
jgi:hypothetical protein